MVKDQFRSEDMTSEVHRKSANMKKIETRRIANAQNFPALPPKQLNSKF